MTHTKKTLLAMLVTLSIGLTLSSSAMAYYFFVDNRTHTTTLRMTEGIFFKSERIIQPGQTGHIYTVFGIYWPTVYYQKEEQWQAIPHCYSFGDWAMYTVNVSDGVNEVPTCSLGPSQFKRYRY